MAVRNRNYLLERRSMKRAGDIALSGVLLVALSPLFVMIALQVRHTMGSPVLFRQTRPGLNGEPFEMIKFRTMSQASGTSKSHLDDAARLTDFGRFLRRTSLDELPEL